MPVSVLTVSPRTVAAHFEYVGQAEASKHIEVRSNVTGVIVARPYVEGSDVARGTVLFKIDPTTYKAAYENALGALNDAKAKLANAEKNYNRLKPLLAERAVAQKDVDDAEAAYRQAEADVQSDQGAVDKAKKDLDDTDVRADVAGRVGLAQMQLGARVTGPSDLLTTLDQVDPIYVRFNPSDQDLLQWRRDIAAKRLELPSGPLKVQVALPDGSVYQRPGTVNFADIALQASTGTQTYRASFQNTDHILLPQQFLRVELLDIKRVGAILVPQRAVQQGITGQYVFTVTDSNKVALRPVQAANWEGTQWVINDGLKPGDKVIVDGIQKIGPGAAVTPVPYKPEGDTTLTRTVERDRAAPSTPLVRAGGGRTQ
jgi:membrane fusion protein (multidrug efflux system)